MDYRPKAAFKAMIAIVGLTVGLGAIWLYPHGAIAGTWILLTLGCALLSFAVEDWYRAVEHPRSRFGQFVKHSGLLSLGCSVFFLISLTVLLSLTLAHLPH